MTVLAVESQAADGYVYNQDPSYANARAGVGGGIPLSVDGSKLAVGMVPTYYIFEGFLSFDTSALGAFAVITSAVLKLYAHGDSSTDDFTVQARLRDWEATLDTTDFVAGASLSGLTLLAHYNTANGWTDGYKTFVDDAFAANINKTGSTRLLLCSDAEVAGTAPGSAREVEAYSSEHGAGYRPTLTITYTINYVAGVTRDSAGNVLGSCVVKVYRTSDDVEVGSATSDASTGAFSIPVQSTISHYLVAYKAGSPDVAGVSLNTLVGS